MKTNVKIFLAMALVAMTFTSGANAGTLQENFVQQQLTSLQAQNQLIAQMIATRTIDNASCQFYVGGLQDMTKGFVRTASSIGVSEAEIRNTLAQINLVSIEQCR